ncbi:interferon-induced very large GTPase 1-like [Hyperolius riggenbachi]|uniref:interferon-induced very large GTPase 1-like n=1 Tax=Hyperolius riggenbachi TaxID=752182 RepID=UPI0035A347C1
MTSERSCAPMDDAGVTHTAKDNNLKSGGFQGKLSTWETVRRLLCTNSSMFAEFAFNNLPSSSTKLSPFQVVTGRSPKFTSFSSSHSSHPVLDEWISQMQTVWAQIEVDGEPEYEIERIPDSLKFLNSLELERLWPRGEKLGSCTGMRVSKDQEKMGCESPDPWEILQPQKEQVFVQSTSSLWHRTGQLASAGAVRTTSKSARMRREGARDGGGEIEVISVGQSAERGWRKPQNVILLPSCVHQYHFRDSQQLRVLAVRVGGREHLLTSSGLHVIELHVAPGFSVSSTTHSTYRFVETEKPSDTWRSIPWSPEVMSAHKELTDILSRLGLENYITSKLTLSDFLNIGSNAVEEIVPKSIKDLAWCFLQKLMTLNVSARNTSLCQTTEDEFYYDTLNLNTADTVPIHHLDVLCAVLHCSDSFLQQEIVTKMSLCQFAIPLLLPAVDGPCTFMLWAMRDIVKRWQPLSLENGKGFREDYLVNIRMPTFSFTRLGKCKLSKSKVLNSVLNLPQCSHDMFVNWEMECGSVPKTISNGLAEISFFFPREVKGSIFPESFAATNLHGDLRYHLAQFTFLTRISSIVFIVIENITEEYVNLLLKHADENTNYCLMIGKNDNDGNPESVELLKRLTKRLKMRIIIYTANVLTLTSALKTHIARCFQDASCQQLSISDMTDTADQLGIEVDEHKPECKRAKEQAWLITQEIGDVIQYKSERMRLQGDLWKKISKNEKEKCRKRNQGSMRGADYTVKLDQERVQLHKEQNQHNVPSDILNFINIITQSSVSEKCYFIKWMKFYLDVIGREKISTLRSEFNNKKKSDKDGLQALARKISDSSLGVEHFLRELGQFYEAECSLVTEERMTHSQVQHANLPGVAADLLLNGFPLELIDGDVSNIPLHWITDVLKEVDTKTGGKCNIRVITVLGVQSSGKSTLLNTMFGLQFPVASGRCTRGAFMTLLKVTDVQEKLGCQFILIIDTEGLRAPELSSLEDSYEHDNELATLVVGLSDITLVNISTENTAEMNDTLQVVVHAFLRMSEFGKRPSCYFVHQNVSDIAAEINNMAARTKLFDDLCEMTQLAAKMENIETSILFSDVIDYDPEKKSWYIPGLFYGVPPMAAVSSGYSNKVFSLKSRLFQSLMATTSPGPQSFKSFSELIKSLWVAVKYENFIFNFRNVLVAAAYDAIFTKYSELEWKFKNRVQEWWSEEENNIKNELQNKTDVKSLENSTMQFATQLLDREESHMERELNTYFESGTNNVHLVGRYKEDFLGYIRCLKQNQNVFISSKFWETVKIENEMIQVRDQKEGYQKNIEKNLNKYLNEHTQISNLSNAELEQRYNDLWADIDSQLNVVEAKTRNIEREIIEHLQKEMQRRAGALQQELHNVKSLREYDKPSFEMKKEYVRKDKSWTAIIKSIFKKDCYVKLNDMAVTIASKCQDYVTERRSVREDYNEVHCQTLLDMINDALSKEDVKKLQPSYLLELHLKLYVLAKAAPLFQKMHEDYRKINDPKECINDLKQRYYFIFNEKIQKKEESDTRAIQFCKQILEPAIKTYIYQNLGRKIVNDILSGADATMFKSQTSFQFNILKELLEIQSFQNYAEYINEYEIYIKNWIHRYILQQYRSSLKLEKLVQELIVSVSLKIVSALKSPRVRGSQDMPTFFKMFCSTLNKYLVILNNDMKIMTFQNISDVAQFCHHVESSLNVIVNELNSDMKSMAIELVINSLRIRPQDELFKKMVGCGQKCPFCRVPCEAGGTNHKEHFTLAHRPKGLAQYTWSDCNDLCNSICSIDVRSNDKFINPDTNGEWYFYKHYRAIYPNWKILPDLGNASNYWKYVLKEFNTQFAHLYSAKPADIPLDWLKINKEEALYSLEDTYNKSA